MMMPQYLVIKIRIPCAFLIVVMLLVWTGLALNAAFHAPRTGAECIVEADGQATAGGGIPISRPMGGNSQPALGMLLVSSRGLGDHNFAWTVMPLAAYDNKCSNGLIVNRPSGISLTPLLPQIWTQRGQSDRVYLGGLLESLSMTFLSRSRFKPEESMCVLADMRTNSRFDLLEQVAGEDGGEFRVCDGYAGWALGQPDGEIQQRDSHILPAEASLHLSLVPEGVWEELIVRVERAGRPSEDPFRGLTYPRYREFSQRPALASIPLILDSTYYEEPGREVCTCA